MDYDRLLRSSRKKPLLEMDSLVGESGFTALSFGQEAIKRVIPHRDPFLLIDALHGLYRSEDTEVIFGSRYIDRADPVFKGHFPDFPVYPGCLQVEMSGQLGLCLTHFLGREDADIPMDASPVPVRATKLLGAYFVTPLLPDKEAWIIVRKLQYDGYFGTVHSQVLCGGQVCCTSIAEVVFLSEAL